MATAGDIVNLVLKDAGAFGVGQTPLQADLDDSLFRLNMMISQWAKRRWLVYQLVESSAAASGAASYTVGPGQTLVTAARVDRIDAVFVRKTSDSTDTSCKLVASREEFDRISTKAELGDPAQYAFFDSGYPTGVLYLWPRPSVAYTIKINTKQVLSEFASLATTVSLPAEYNQAIYFNLIQMTRAAYRLAPDEYFDRMAEETLAVIQQANLQTTPLRTPKGMGSTVADLVNLALEDSGAFSAERPPNYQDTIDALWRLNMMLGQWNRRRWLIYHLVETSVVCDSAKLSYTVGAGGDFAIARPDQIEAAFIRQVVPSYPNVVDWSLIPIFSYEDYSSITVKTLRAAPSQYYFYDSGFPLGKVYPWPVPGSQYELHILTKAVLTTFGALADPINLPPEYFQALYLNLAVTLRMAYDTPERPLPPKRDLNGLAKAALQTIRHSNFQIGQLRLPYSITGGPAYDVFSDRGGR